MEGFLFLNESNSSMSFPHYKDKHKLRSVTTAKRFLKGKDSKLLEEMPKSVILSFNRGFTKAILKEYDNEKLKLGLFGEVHKLKVKTKDDAKANVGLVSGFGIGAPITAGLIEELKVLGVKNIIGVGTAGSLQLERQPGDIIVCSKALRDEGTSYHYVKAAGYGTLSYARPSLKLLQFIVEQLKKDKVPYLLGGTWTTDAPYRETRQEIEKYRKEGIVTVDMEASAIYVVARKRQARAASLFVISDIVAGEKWKTAFSSKAVSDSLMKAFDVALKALANPKV